MMQTKLCCGCRACEQSCEKKAIIIATDREGFLFSKIDMDRCENCGICKIVCPMLHGTVTTIADTAHLFFHKSAQYRKQASSSGAFEAICKVWTQNRPFSVFGCVMGADAHSAYHTEAIDWAQFDGFRKSKYVASDTKNTFSRVKECLKEGRRVVYSGTPCQITGLRNYLGKDDENLLTIDFVCHGTPSPLALTQYVDSVEKKFKKPVKEFIFRNKQYLNGKWDVLGVKIGFSDQSYYEIPFADCSYMCWFLEGALNRESCYHCRFASVQRYSDITMGDYWGIEKIHPELSNTEVDGTSMLLLNTEKGRKIGEILKKQEDILWEAHSIDIALANNKQLTAPTERHPYRNTIYTYLAHKDFETAFQWQIYGKPSQRVKQKMVRAFKKFTNKMRKR